MNFNDKIEHLHPIKAPSDVIFSPETIGWLILGIILILVAITIIASIVIAYQKAAYRRNAQMTLKNNYSSYRNNEISQQQLFANISKIMKSTAITTFGRENVAGFSGENWKNFIKKTYRNKAFSDKELTAIDKRQYDTSITVNNNEIKRIVKQVNKWLGGHHA